MIGYALVALNLIAFVLIWRLGKMSDRVAVVLLLAGIGLGAVSWTWTIGTWRVGTAVFNLGFFLVMWIVAARAGRWWIVTFCSLQLLITTTHLLPLMTDDLYTMSGFVARQALWALITILFFAAAWECWAARKFAREGRDHVQDVQGGV